MWNSSQTAAYLALFDNCTLRVMNNTALIIGAGIAGLTSAIALERKGWKCTITEASPSVRTNGAGIVLAANALRALDALGIAHEIASRGHVLTRMSIRTGSGTVITEIDSSRNHYPTVALSRSELHSALRMALGATQIVPGMQAVSVNTDGAVQTVTYANGTHVSADLVVVADGIHSSLRRQLVPQSTPRYAGYTCWRNVVKVADLAITESTEYWGRKGRVGIVPLGGGNVYWYACVNAAQQAEWARQTTTTDLAHRFADYHAPVAEIISASSNETLIWSDISDIAPLDRFVYGNTVLVGDAAHATTPNLGQGAGQAIEDAATLGLCISASALHESLLHFEHRRVPRTRRIIIDSRRLGWMAQRSNPLLAWVRNTLAAHIPAPHIGEEPMLQKSA